MAIDPRRLLEALGGKEVDFIPFHLDVPTLRSGLNFTDAWFA